ncbi:hypothetical protein GF366_05045 [Candidatus Peregrinibacteria bacterium]|nr:hypothetical protein [Candidatus Peregrinibacteria bacterium]
MRKKTFYFLLVIFACVFAVKFLLTLLYYGPTIIPDEGCIIETSKYFANNFKIVKCGDITNAPHGYISPLVTILFSVFYLFLAPLKAYKAILIFHSLIVSSLVFPLYGILKKFKIKDRLIFLFTILILFVPQFLVYEKSVMTETLFAVTNVWFLYFYINSFDRKKKKNKIISIILAVIAVFMRPYGFLTLFALAVNEFIVSKRKKVAAIIFIPVLGVILIPALLIYSDILANLFQKGLSIFDFDNFKGFVESIINQFNSLSIATLSIPLIIFASRFGKSGFKHFEKIKYFLLSFIFINLLISTQHMYGYFLEYGMQPDLLFRYINVSIIFVLIFSTVFLLKYKEFRLDRKNMIISAVVLLLLLFVNVEFYRRQFVFEYSHLDYFPFYYSYYLFLVIVLFVLLINNFRKALISLIFAILMIHSVFGIAVTSKYSSDVQQLNPIYQEFKYEDYEILYILNSAVGQFPSTYWSVLTLTNNDIQTAFYDLQKQGESSKISELYLLNEEVEKVDVKLEDFDYIITDLDLDLPIYMKSTFSKVYETKK